MPGADPKMAACNTDPLMIKRHVQYLYDENFLQKAMGSFDKISGNMISGVFGEDNLFFEHNGFDFDEIRKMMDEHKRTENPYADAAPYRNRQPKLLHMVHRHLFAKASRHTTPA